MEIPRAFKRLDTRLAVLTRQLHSFVFGTFKKRPVFFVFFSALVLLGIGIATRTVFADDGGIVQGLILWFLEAILAIARLFLALAMFCLSFFIQLAGYNGYLDTPIVIIGWRMIRDIANMFFVVALLVIAFATILGKENYEWKKTMVKLVLAAIFINFSLLICGIVIDAAHVFTITFLNALAPVASGNLISMFNMDEMFKIVTDPQTASQGTSLNMELLGGSIMALFFAALTLAAIGAYAIMILYRMVYLWVLLILSPIAFAAMALPTTESYAQEWRQEFTKYVLVAPIMVFFLWLSFATLGQGDIQAQLASNLSSFQSDPTVAALQGQSTTFNAATTWANMASFLVAFAFLLAGIQQVQKLGVAGSDWLDSGMSFMKNVATVASGYMAGRWLYEQGKELTMSPVKTALKTEWEGVKGRYYGSATKKNEDLVGVEKAMAWFARRELSRKKRLAKTEKQTKQLYEEGWAGTGSESGGRLFGTIHGGDLGKSETRDLTWKLTMPLRMMGISGFAGYTREEALYKGQEAPDRETEGRLKGMKARSSAKTEAFAAKGYQDIMVNPRVKDGEVKPGSGTVAEEMAGWQEMAKATGLESDIVVEEAKRQFRTEESSFGKKKKGRSYLKRRVGAEELKHARELTTDLVKEEERRKFLGSHAGHDAEHEAMESAERIETNKAQLEAIRAGGRREALKHLEHENNLEERDKALAEVEAAKKESEAILALSEKETYEHIGEGIMSRINLAEQGIDLAKNFIDNLKKKGLQNEFRNAGLEIAKLIGKAATEGIPEMSRELDRIAATSPYVAALREHQYTDREKDKLALIQGEAQAAASAGFVELPTGGTSTPSTALEAMSKRLTDGLNSLEAAALARSLSTNMAYLIHRRATDKTYKGPDEYERAYSFGTVNKVTAEAYLDDTAADFATMFNRIEANDPTLGEADKAMYKHMMELFKTTFRDFGIEKVKVVDAATGKDVERWIGKSNANTARLFQNLSITGGDVDYVARHERVARGQGADEAYWDAAKRVLGAEYDDFRKMTDESETYFKEAAGLFKRHALNAKHSENGGGQIFDESTGGHRLSTPAEQAAIMRAEERKRGQKIDYQVHSFGTVDTSHSNVLYEVDRGAYRSLVGSINTYLDAKKIQDRTRDALLGYKPSTEAVLHDGSGVLGGEDAMRREIYGDDKTFLRNVLLPQVLENARLVAMNSFSKFSNTSKEAAEGGGVVDIVIPGLIGADGKNMRFENMADVAKVLKEKLGEIGVSDAEAVTVGKELEEVEKRMRELHDVWRSKNKANPSKNRSKTDGEDEEDTP